MNSQSSMVGEKGTFNLIPESWRVASVRTRARFFKGAVLQQTDLVAEAEQSSLSDLMRDRLNVGKFLDIKVSETDDLEAPINVFEAFGYCKELPILGLGPAYNNRVAIRLFGFQNRGLTITPMVNPHAAPKSFKYLEFGEYSSLEGRDIDERKLEKVEKMKTQNVLHYLRLIKEVISSGDNHVTLMYNWLMSIYHLKLTSEVSAEAVFTPVEAPAFISASKFPNETTESAKGLSYQGKLMRYLPTLRGENYQAIDSFPEATMRKRKELIVFPTQLSTEQYAHLYYALSNTKTTVTHGTKILGSQSMFEASKVNLTNEVTIILDELDNDLKMAPIMSGSYKISLQWRVLSEMLEKYVAYYGISDQLAEAKALVLESIIDMNMKVTLPIMQHSVDWAIRLNTFAQQTSGRLVCTPGENVTAICYFVQTITAKMKHILLDRSLGEIIKAGFTLNDTEAVKMITVHVNDIGHRDGYFVKLAVNALIGRSATVMSCGARIELRDIFDFSVVNGQVVKHIKPNSFIILKETPKVAEVAASLKRSTATEWVGKTLTDAEYKIGKDLFSNGITTTSNGMMSTKHWAENELNLDFGGTAGVLGTKRYINTLLMANIKERHVNNMTNDMQMLYVGREGITANEIKATIVLQNPNISVAEQIEEFPTEALRTAPSWSDKLRAKKAEAIRFAAAQAKYYAAKKIQDDALLAKEAAEEAEQLKREKEADEKERQRMETEALQAKPPVADIVETDELETENGGPPFEYTFNPPPDGNCGWHCMEKIVGYNVYPEVIEADPTMADRLTTATDMFRVAKAYEFSLVVEEHRIETGKWLKYIDSSNKYENKGTLIAWYGHWYLRENRNGGKPHKKKKNKKNNFIDLLKDGQDGKVEVEDITLCSVCGDQEPNAKLYNPGGHQCDNPSPTEKPNDIIPGGNGTRYKLGLQMLSLKSAVAGKEHIVQNSSQTYNNLFLQPDMSAAQINVGDIANMDCLDIANSVRFETAAQGLGMALCLWDDYGPSRGYKEPEWAQNTSGTIIEHLIVMLLRRGYAPVIINRQRQRWAQYYFHDNKGPPIYLEMNNQINLMFLFSENSMYLSNPAEFFSTFGCRTMATQTKYNVCCSDPEKVLSPVFTRPRQCVAQMPMCPPHMVADKAMQKCVDPTKRIGPTWPFWVPATCVLAVGAAVIMTSVRWMVIRRRGRLGPNQVEMGQALADFHQGVRGGYFAAAQAVIDLDSVDIEPWEDFDVGVDSTRDVQNMLPTERDL